MFCINSIENTSRRLALAAAIISVPVISHAQTYPAQSFFVLDNPGDPAFNQLLGINNNQIIVGYFGDGTQKPNNGYVLVPPFHYAPENFAGTPLNNTQIKQTQAIGINNSEVPITVGFWQDQQGVQYGWANIRGQTVAQSFQTILDPHGAPGFNQNLLGVNKNNLAAGFWTDTGGREHGFVVDLASNPLKFGEYPPSLFSGAVATQVSGINDNNLICGFWTDTKGNNHGFSGPLNGPFTSFMATHGGHPEISTTVLGCSNKFIVGSYVAPGGATFGFVYDGKTFTRFDAKGASQTPAFGVAGTAINGVDDAGDFVGFFSDGKVVHGFANYAVSTGKQ
jgi:hypothetical protein